MFYTLILTLHNLFRWVVVITAAWALWRAYRGWLARRIWAVPDRRAGLFLTMALDIQFLLGLILAFVSPLSRAAFADLGAAMSAGELRFFVAEHIPLMVVAVVLAHLGSMASRKASDDPARHRRAALWYSLTTLALLIAIPWWRPLLRLFS